MSRPLKSLTFLFLVTSLLTVFQNCAEADFASGTHSSQGHTVQHIDDHTILESGVASTRDVNSKADVLFVVDESVSMKDILPQFKAGFASLSSNVYPADTLMAVTNTAPAPYLNVAANIFDPTKSWIDDAPTAAQPGFLKLVTRASIASFKSAVPSNNQFPLAGCANEWFRPQEKSPEGTLCLNAHSQISLIGTGVESGATTLSQMIKNRQNSGKRTFREGALANVIFVSDTHDPGAAYYGQPKAPANLPTYDALVQQIHAANPELAGLKFHGIVPLPPVGHAQLQGVNTIGYIPPTLKDSNVSGEDMWDFHYMEYIRKSGGTAMHPLNNVWSTALQQMVKEASVQRTPLFVTNYEIKDLIELKVNGVLLSASEFTLHADKRTIELHYNAAWPAQINIQARYTY
jgi:hypothetical protein